MIVFGIASGLSQDVDDFCATREEAEAALAEVLADEPDFEGALWVEPVRLDFCLN